MDADEREIMDFLKSAGDMWVNSKEICRRAGGKRRYNEDPHWAIPALQRLRERNILEADLFGRYHIKPQPKHRSDQAMSEETQRIIKAGGGTVDLGDLEESLDDTGEQP